jgi:hypothetical protein
MDKPTIITIKIYSTGPQFEVEGIDFSETERLQVIPNELFNENIHIGRHCFTLDNQDFCLVEDRRMFEDDFAWLEETLKLNDLKLTKSSIPSISNIPLSYLSRECKSKSGQ